MMIFSVMILLITMMTHLLWSRGCRGRVWSVWEPPWCCGGWFPSPWSWSPQPRELSVSPGPGPGRTSCWSGLPRCPQWCSWRVCPSWWWGPPSPGWHCPCPACSPHSECCQPFLMMTPGSETLFNHLYSLPPLPPLLEICQWNVEIWTLNTSQQGNLCLIQQAVG